RGSGDRRAHVRARRPQDIYFSRAARAASSGDPAQALVHRPPLRRRRVAGAIDVDSPEPTVDPRSGRAVEARQRRLARRLDSVEPGYRADAGGSNSADLSRPLSARWLVRAAAVGVTRL